MKHRDEVEAKLAAYEALLIRWASRLDLISPADLPRLRERHIDDSLRALALVDRFPTGPCIDVGSGAGLPGIPLAIASGRQWRLLEPRRGRAAFLEEVARELDLDNCEVVAMDAESAAQQPAFGRAHTIAAARALARPTVALALCAPLVAPKGATILFLGANAEIPPEAEESAPGLITIRKDAD